MEARAGKASLEMKLDWEARPMASLLGLSGPIAVSMVSYSAMTLVDTVLVGRLGASALAGVGLAGITTFVLLCFAIGLLRAVKVHVSHEVGRGHSDECAAYLGAGLVWALSLGVLATAAGLLLATVIVDFAASEAAGECAASYLRIRILGAPVVLAGAAIREALYGSQKSKAPMRAAVVANVFNMVAGYVMIVPLDGGVAGAAWATVAAHVVETSMLAMAQRAEGFGLGKTRAPHVAAVLRTGVPVGAQFVLEIGAFALLSAMVSAFGEAQMAAHQIAIQACHFSFLPVVALGEGASVLAGQAIGAGRFELVRVVARKAMLVAGAYMGFCTFVLAVFSGSIVTAFTDDEAVRTIAVTLLHVAAVFQLFDGAGIVARGVLRGTGDVRAPAAIGIATAWVCTPPLTWLLGARFGMGALGGWIGLSAEILVGAVLFWMRLERMGWLPAARAAAAEREPVLPAMTANGETQLAG